MKPPVTTRKLTTLSLLAAIALALYAVESALPPHCPDPGHQAGAFQYNNACCSMEIFRKRRLFRASGADPFSDHVLRAGHEPPVQPVWWYTLPVCHAACEAAVAWELPVPRKHDRCCFSQSGADWSGVSADFRSRRACLSAVFASQRSGDRSVHWSLCPLYASLPSVISTGSSASICATVL